MFSVCPPPGRGGPQSQVLCKVSGPMSFFWGGVPPIPGPMSVLGVPQSQVLSNVSGPRSFWGGVPQSQVLSKVSGPRSFLRGAPVPGSFQGLWPQVLLGGGGIPVPAGGYPTPGQGSTQSWLGGGPRTAVPPNQERSGVPPSQNREGTARTGLGHPLGQVTLRAVCFMQFPTGGLSCLVLILC